MRLTAREKDDTDANSRPSHDTYPSGSKSALWVTSL